MHRLRTRPVTGIRHVMAAGRKPLTAVRFDPDLIEIIRSEAAARERSLAYILNEIVRQHYAAKGKAKPKVRAEAD